MERMVTLCAFIKMDDMPINNGIVLIEKQRPEWMKGMFNMPGGHIEQQVTPGGEKYWETPEEAAIREFKEEVGLEIPLESILRIGVLRPNEEAVVYICATALDVDVRAVELASVVATQQHGERVVIQPIGEALQSARLLPDMYFVIPEALKAITKWESLIMGEDK